MSLIPHVNGEASVWVGTGSAGALEELGISVEGVTFQETLLTEDVLIDTYFKQPFDKQYSLTSVKITVDLIIWEATVLAKLKGRLIGITQGTFGTAGALIVAGGFTTRLLIMSTPAGSGITGVEPCWNFPRCFLDGAYEAKFGTEVTRYKLMFTAMPSQQLSTSYGAVLWNTTCS